MTADQFVVWLRLYLRGRKLDDVDLTLVWERLGETRETPTYSRQETA